MWRTCRTVLRYRGLLATLVRRELAARYRGSALGFLWSLVNPLLLLGVYSLVFGYLLVPRSEALDGAVAATDPYALFLITGLFPWVWASTSLLDGATSLSTNAGLIRKAVFPVDLLPLVAVGSNLVHLLLAMPILIGALLVGRWLGYPVLSASSFLVVLVIAIELMMLAGLALGLSALNVHFKDVRDLLANGLQLLFFLAPILYSLDSIIWPGIRNLIRMNPMTPFTQAFQELLFRGDVPSLWIWLHMIALATISLGVGSWLFHRLEDTLVESV